MKDFSRRSVMKGMLALGVGSTALGWAQVSLAQGTPVRGGTFTAVTGSEPTTMDPIRVTDFGGDAKVYNLFYERLLWQDFDGNFHPVLADSWEIAEDGLSVTFKLRSDVKFHDGTDFNADAVKFNLDRGRAEGPDIRTAPFLATIDNVEVVDPTTVKINLKTPAPALLANIAADSGFMVSPTAVQTQGEEAYARNPVGTGPFKFVSWSSGRFEAERFDGYWRKSEAGEQLPYLDRVVITVVPTAAVQLVQVKTGDALFGDGVQPQDVDAIEAEPEIELVPRVALNTWYLSFNNKGPLFGENKNLRKAVSHAINRDAIAQIISNGRGKGAIGPESPNSWATGPELQGHVYDIELAKAAYAESGHSGPIVLNVIQRDPDAQVSQIIQGMLKQAGIDLQIEVSERAAYLEKVLNNGPFQMAMSVVSTPRPDPDANFTQNYSRTAATPYGNLHDERIWDLVDQARTEFDREKRRLMYVQIQQIILDEYYQTFLFWQPGFFMRNKKVEGMRLERSFSWSLGDTWIEA